MADDNIHIINDRIPETTRYLLYGVLVDEYCKPILAAAITQLLLTLKVRDTGVIINTISGEDIKNANHGTLQASTGYFEVKLKPVDNVRIDQSLEEEWHVALIECRYDTDGKAEFEYHFRIRPRA